MLPKEFRCLLVEKQHSEVVSSVQVVPIVRLSMGDVAIKVEWSSVNYKDALAASGHPGVAKTLPHVPGIDAAGEVIESNVDGIHVGQRAIVTGYDLGQGHWGGWSEFVRVPASWVVPLPSNLSVREAMVLGTAGFTAAQCVLALQQNQVMPACGEVVVTGASGGVGSLAVRLLAHLGYKVVAVSGKPELHAKLIELGASRVLTRAEFQDSSPRPMLRAQWAGGVDTVGGETLVRLLRSVAYGGSVAACGLVTGAELNMTLYPFLLRGISLCGIASADCPMDKRKRIWNLLASDWKLSNLEQLVTEIGLADLPNSTRKILAGEVAGRVLVDPSKLS